MIKLYKKEKNSLKYAECWVHNGIATIHIGIVGETGQTKELSCNNEAAFLNKFHEEYEAQKFKKWPDNLYHWLILQWPMKTFEASKKDYQIKDRASEVLRELLGWRGLGNVDGFDMGRTLKVATEFVLNIFCMVVDSDIAINCILKELPIRLDCSRLKIASRSYTEDFYKLRYSADPKIDWFHI